MTNENTTEPASKTVRELAADFATLANLNPPTPERPFVLVPDGVKALDLKSLLPRAPLTDVLQNNTFIEKESFLAYFKKYSVGQQPALFAIREEGDGFKLLCIFDYHEADGKTLNPKRGEHKAVLKLKYTPEFSTWLTKNAKSFPQIEFAEFVEDYTHVFVEPTGADMLEIAQSLQGLTTVHWGAGQRIANGQVMLSYKESADMTAGNGDLRVPERFIINTQIFAHVPAVNIQAALRTRREQAKLFFSYKLIRVQPLIDAAVDEIVSAIEAVTKLPIFYVEHMPNKTL